MLNSIKLIFYEFRRSSRTLLPLTLLLVMTEALLFIGIRLAGDVGKPISAGTMYILFADVPLLFYLLPLTVPLMYFLRSVSGRDACLMRVLPVLPDASLSAMIINSFVWTIAAEGFRTVLTAFSLALNASLAQLEREDVFLLIFSAYGATGFVLALVRNVLAVIFFQLYIAMVVLLAEMSLRHKRLLAFVYGLAGSVLMFFAFAYLTVYGGTAESSAGAAFIRYFPEIIFLSCFIVIFSIVSAFILKRRHDIE